MYFATGEAEIFQTLHN